MKRRYQIFLLLLTLLLCTSITIGTSYSLWAINHTQTNANNVNTGCFTFAFTEGTNNINLTNTYPISDTKGLATTPYTFTIHNTCSIAAKTNIALDTINTSTLNRSYLKVAIQTNGLGDLNKGILSSYPVGQVQDTSTMSDAYIIKTDTLAPDETKSYSIWLWVDEAVGNDVEGTTYTGKVVISEEAIVGSGNLASTLLNNAGGTTTIAAKTAPDFGTIATTDEGMYAMADDYGTSYYYRGAITNNNVIFGGFCWKVIRINGNGTTRMIYNGTPSNGQCTATGTATRIGTSAFNTNSNDNAYVGYMYGTAGSTTYAATHANTNSSTIKTVIDNWYNTNLSSYADKISDTLFCNDRSIASTAATWATDDTALGYGTNITFYGSYNRLYPNKSPILTCPNKHDRFTVDDTIIGNGDLTYPVSLITADEVAVAGGVYATTNSSYYLYTGSNYWTVSVRNFISANAREFYVHPIGSLLSDSLVSSLYGGARPVINLNTGTLFNSGDGTSTNPFVIS
jgi:hypothetical protein